MKNFARGLTAALLLAAAPLAAQAAAPKTYQVTGPVLAQTDSTLTVQKGSEKWEIATGGATLPAGLKVGDKVTIQYTMTAASVVDKSAGVSTTTTKSTTTKTSE